MDPVTTAAVISAGSNILGGLMGRKNANAANDMSREFAQNGISWKVADAKRAGIHPLYAIGASTAMPAPVSAGDYGISAAGQDVSRAFYATASRQERADSNNAKLSALQVEHAELQNELLKSQIARMNQAQVGPPLPFGLAGSVSELTSDSVPWVGSARIKPAEIESVSPQAPSVTAGTHAGFSEFDLGALGKWKLPSDKLSQALEDLDMGKYAAIAAANADKLPRAPTVDDLKWAAKGLFPAKPEWVKRLELQTGVPMIPVKGGLYWRFFGAKDPLDRRK